MRRVAEVVAEASALADTPQDDLDLKKVLAIFLRTWPYIKPSTAHLANFVLVSAIFFFAGTALGLILVALAANGIMASEPVGEFYVYIYGLDPDRFLNVDSLSDQARRDLAWPTVYTATVGAFVLIGGAQLLVYYSVWIFQAINQRMRVHLIDQLLAQSLSYHATAKTGDAIYRVYQDSAMVTAIIRYAFLEPLMFIGRYVGGLVIVAAFSPTLALILLFTALPITWLGRKFSSPLRIKFRNARERNADLTSWIQESVQGVRVIKASGAEKERTAEFEKRSHEAFDAAFDSRVSLNVLGILSFATVAVSMLALQAIAATYTLQDAATFARDLLLAFGFAVWNFGTFSAATARTSDGFVSLRSIMALWGRAQDMAIGLNRVFSVMDLKPDIVDAKNAKPMPPLSHSVSFQHVDFAYIDGQPVLHDVDFTASIGSITAIVGPTGTGKSTLMSLLLRLADPDQGCIMVDDTDIRDFTIDSLRHGISIATQENILFSDSVLNNILYAAPDANRQGAIEAARVVCAHDFIEALPQGYDTELGERAIKLSSGQRQRLVLARAIVRDTPILILDEPTAALDAQTEHDVLANIRDWSKERCIFLITHRLSTIRQADQVIYLRDGQVLAHGHHDALLALESGAYKEFVAAETGVT